MLCQVAGDILLHQVRRLLVLNRQFRKGSGELVRRHVPDRRRLEAFRIGELHAAFQHVVQALFTPAEVVQLHQVRHRRLHFLAAERQRHLVLRDLARIDLDVLRHIVRGFFQDRRLLVLGVSELPEDRIARLSEPVEIVFRRLHIEHQPVHPSRPGRHLLADRLLAGILRPETLCCSGQALGLSDAERLVRVLYDRGDITQRIVHHGQLLRAHL